MVLFITTPAQLETIITVYMMVLPETLHQISTMQSFKSYLKNKYKKFPGVLLIFKILTPCFIIHLLAAVLEVRERIFIIDKKKGNRLHKMNIL